MSLLNTSSIFSAEGIIDFILFGGDSAILNAYSILVSIMLGNVGRVC